MSEPQLKNWWEKKSGTAKLFTALVISILLGMGLCGMGAVADSYERTSEGLLIAGCVCFWGGILVAVVAKVVLAAVEFARKR
ncbi:MAG: hypothetical protein V4555_19380 [Acidobacteriota bacterium]